MPKCPYYPVSVLSGLSQKRKTSRTHVSSIQRLKQTFLRQQNVLQFLNCNLNCNRKWKCNCSKFRLIHSLSLGLKLLYYS